MYAMNPGGLHHGFLRKYGGFMFKQWKERYLVLTAEGNLLVSHDGHSPPDQVVSLSRDCLLMAEGKDILDLPRLPLGGHRDCCLALILTQDKFLLLLAENANDCSQWLNVLRKVRESMASGVYSWKRQQSLTTGITDEDHLPDHIPDKDPITSQVRDGDAPITYSKKANTSKHQSFRRGKGVLPHRAVQGGPLVLPLRSPNCLRHGNSSDAQAVRAVCLLMGGTAASSALGFLGSLSAPSHNIQSVDLNSSGDLPGLGTGGEHHTCNLAPDSPNFHSFDFEGDSNFDSFDCGGFAF